MGLSSGETSFVKIASWIYLGPHQAKAPVQNDTHVKPNVENKKVILVARLFRSSI